MLAQTFEEAFRLVRKLAEDFRRNEAEFLSPAYNETAVREVFINRFWMALGWDVTHETQKNPYECEVTVERNVNVEGRGKRADYSFAVAPNFRDVRFFVEAKKPSRQLDNAQDYFQTMRYGWHARTPVAVLTDFEQFRVLDCRFKPDVETVLQYGALEKFHYTDYEDEEKFRRLYHLFSRADVGRGSLEQYVAGLQKPGGRGMQRALFAKGAYQSIDESFLRDLDAYREELARAFSKANPQLDGAQLTEATQRTLDRLVFMRFLEDKLIETDELVERFAQSNAPWAEFVATSRKLNAVYNGIIFKPHEIDAPTFRVDEPAFAGICENLSHARSAYDFNLIPIHILGSIYERFLGKSIVVEAGGARVLEKPEVRKAGGVYYTPEYIVRYIVEQTVGALIKGRTPEQLRPLRFADISCGSGSFLLGVYDALLRYHAEYYNRNKRTRAEGLKAGCTETDEGTLRLSLLQKRTILLNNVYGVDVDAQAVEVAQLSLYLKLLEEETTASARTHQLSFREALLPSLNRNVVSGNSLIDFDILSGHLFEPEEERKLNPMSFAQEFPQIMRDGGFDAIIGNPPYIGFHGFKKEKDYLKEKFVSAKGKFDIYLPFIERGISLLKNNGTLGFICPTNFAKREHGKSLRSYLKNSIKVLEICDFQDVQIFSGALNYTGIFIFQKASPTKDHEFPYKTRSLEAAGFNFLQSALDDDAWIVRDAAVSKFVARVKAQSRVSPLGKLTNGISEGIVTGQNEVFLLPLERARELDLEDEVIRLCVRGRQIRRYLVEEATEAVIYPYELVNGRTQVIPEKVFRQYLQVWSYLNQRRDELKGRSYFEASSKAWYELWCQRDIKLLSAPKIVVPELSDHNRFAIADPTHFYGDTVCGITLLHNVEESLFYFLGLLNSKFIEFYYKQTTVPKANQFYIYKTMFLKNIPIRTIDFSDADDKARHERMVALVEGMLAAKRQLAGAGTEAERNQCERKCANLDGQIDALVYELYGLTPQEIALVEAG
jgi:type I restriction-modification system DNA methylase subunit